ncbi:TAXI family TRAP transporter solute-binding subunit [Salicibibacter halophilus]|uniref:TAXI family TRAP transporter solute-binding subunit n=1 Tax=Salicibibacter halophilus TaxID=2502791 RepID=A0A514LES4_9BACI|nr:TAXI family TRAP transporter solute-binding subunit [Salicibibacter halophilus]
MDNQEVRLLKHHRYTVFFLLLVLGIICVSCANPRASSQTLEIGEEGEEMPEEMVWSVYDINAGGYAEASAVANEITEAYGTQIRMLPSSSGVGRMMPLYLGAADVGKIGDEFKFAFEATEEFFDLGWGPQDVRAIWAPISPFGLAVSEDSDIESIEDLEGMRVPHISGNTSVNIKTESMLAFGGLTLDDVDVVDFNDYGGQGQALIQDELDVASINPQAGGMFEADSLDGIRWLQMPASDEEGWEHVHDVASWFYPREIDDGAGMTDDNEILGHGYLMAAYADQDEEDMYAFTKAHVEQYENYEGATANMWTYHPDEVITNPAAIGVPFHEGSIRYLDEIGLWDEQKQEENDALIERQEDLQEAWTIVEEEAEEMNLSEDEHEEHWLERKEELVPEEF